MLTEPQNYHRGVLVGSCERRLLKAKNELFSKSPLNGFSKSIAQNMLIDNSGYYFQVLPTRSEGLSLLSKQNTL